MAKRDRMSGNEAVATAIAVPHTLLKTASGTPSIDRIAGYISAVTLWR